MAEISVLTHPLVIILTTSCKLNRRTGHEGPEGKWRYSSTLSLTSTLDCGLGGQRHAPAALTHAEKRYPLYRRLDGPQGRSGGVRKISPTSGFDPQTVQLYSFFNLNARLWVGGQRHALANLPPGETRYLMYRRLDGPQGWPGRCGKSHLHRDSIPRLSSSTLYLTSTLECGC
jgi:hypothetical protein